MNTKQRGDIAEQAAVLCALKLGWGVLRPVGDRLAYDLVFDVGGVFVKIQVKHSWIHPESGNYVVDNRRTKTNRREMLREPYQESDFDYALVYLSEIDLFYVFPIAEFIGHASTIHMVEGQKRQRKPRSAIFRDAWSAIAQDAERFKLCGHTAFHRPPKVPELTPAPLTSGGS